MDNIRQLISSEVQALFELKKTERAWHIPFLASLSVGTPLLVAYYLGRLDYGIIACIGGLVILYMPATSLAHRMLTLLACSFGFMISYATGIVFSFSPALSAVVLGFFTAGVYWVARKLDLRPPGNFFFIMLASIASSTPYDMASIPARIGLIGMGSMLACILAFFYSLLVLKKEAHETDLILIKQSQFNNYIEAAVFGLFVGGSLLVGNMMELENPYWVPISCVAVMQGMNARHIWQRSVQRILGTFIGLGLAWLLLLPGLVALDVVISILILQFVIEMLIVRHYGLAVIFITPMTIFLAEAGSAMTADPDSLIYSRFMDIVLGSVIGALGGWMLHNQKLRFIAEKQLRKTRITISGK